MLSDVNSDILPDDSPIQMTVTVDNSEIKYDLTTDTDWDCNSGSCTRSWTADKFDGEGEMTFTSTHLILKKQISQECKSAEVDGVKVCLQQGHSLDFVCKYPLDTQTLTNTYDVAGHDTNVSKEGTGKLNYKLVASENVNIGDTVSVKVEAVNKGLVWHSLQDCTVKYQGDTVSILNWDSDKDSIVSYCPNVLNAAVETATHQEVTKFSWTAFKWSTSTPNDDEKQTIQCKISLSKDKPTIKTPSCAEQDETTTTTSTTTTTTSTTTSTTTEYTTTTTTVDPSLPARRPKYTVPAGWRADENYVCESGLRESYLTTQTTDLASCHGQCAALGSELCHAFDFAFPKNPLYFPSSPSFGYCNMWIKCSKVALGESPQKYSYTLYFRQGDGE